MTMLDLRPGPEARTPPGRLGWATPSERSGHGRAQDLTVAPTDAAMARSRLVRRLLAAADFVAAALALVVVVGPSQLQLSSLLLPLVLVVTNKIVGLYDRDDTVMRRSTLDEVPRMAEISGLFALLAWLFAAQLVDTELHRMDVLALWALVFVLVVGARLMARVIGRRVTPSERCAIVGDTATVDRLRARLESSREASVQVVAASALTGASTGEAASDRAFMNWLRRHEVERLIVAQVSGATDQSLDYVRLAKAAGVRVSILPRLFEAIGSSVDFEDVDGMTVLGLRSYGLSRSSRLLKRGLDVAGAGLGLIAVSPLLIGLALLIRLESPGPVFFRQRRVGKDGEPFDMVKFRSMVDGADAMKAALREGAPADDLFKLDADPRVTRVGRFMRATSLDELPQLFNVLQGQMSLVGPRPLVEEEDALIIGIDRSRLHLTPGMTGPWQILGGTRVPLREMVSMDYLYVANWSLWRDVEILLRTAVHMVRRGGV